MDQRRDAEQPPGQRRQIARVRGPEAVQDERVRRCSQVTAASTSAHSRPGGSRPRPAAPQRRAAEAVDCRAAQLGRGGAGEDSAGRTHEILRAGRAASARTRLVSAGMHQSAASALEAGDDQRDFERGAGGGGLGVGGGRSVISVRACRWR